MKWRQGGMELTLGRMFRASVIRCGDKDAVISGDTRYSYSQVEGRANRLANGLLALGLKKGDRCAVVLYNRAEWLEVYFGLAQVGIIAVPVNFRFAQREIEYVLNNAEPRALICEEAFVNIIEGVKDKVPSIKYYICLGTEKGFLDYEDWLAANSSSVPECDVNEDDPFFLGYTSGTTGFPKGAVVSHRNLILHYLASSKELAGIRGTDVMLLVMPIFHSNSTWFLQLMAMTGGTSVVYPSGGFDPEQVLSLIEGESISFTSLVPTMLTMVLNLPEEIRSRYDVSSVRLLMCSSAPLMTKTKEDAISFFRGIDLYEGYGSTETGMVTLLRPEDQLRKMRSVGKPTVGKEVRLLDENGNDVRKGEIGELYARGIGILLDEYWQDSKATRDAFRGEWCSVGDMAREDQEGYIFLEDRKKDMIITGGENVYPTEVENVICKLRNVSEAAVVGLPDELWGERVHAAVELKQGRTATEEEIRSWCRESLAGYKCPKSVDFVEELPKSATGKILRRVVRESCSPKTKSIE